jgi:predicted GIY-YIG superfamily endonuclease
VLANTAKTCRFYQPIHVHKLVHFDEYAEGNDAIAREKQIKDGSRRGKIALIKWRDLFLDLLWLGFTWGASSLGSSR